MLEWIQEFQWGQVLDGIAIGTPLLVVALIAWMFMFAYRPEAPGHTEFPENDDEWDHLDDTELEDGDESI